jgi:hypothetical protein
MTDDTAIPEADEQPVEWDPATDPDGYTNADIRPKDFMLKVFLDFVVGHREEAGGSAPVTVTLGGQTVSGTAIARGEWIDGVASQYEHGGGSGYLRKTFEMVNEKIVEAQDRRAAADLPGRARHFIHMRDVQIGNGGVVTERAYWRGSLDDVTGWSLG